MKRITERSYLCGPGLTYVRNYIGTFNMSIIR
jgi:hypothetical protein